MSENALTPDSKPYITVELWARGVRGEPEPVGLDPVATSRSDWKTTENGLGTVIDTTIKFSADDEKYEVQGIRLTPREGEGVSIELDGGPVLIGGKGWIRSGGIIQFSSGDIIVPFVFDEI